MLVGPRLVLLLPAHVKQVTDLQAYVTGVIPTTESLSKGPKGLVGVALISFLIASHLMMRTPNRILVVGLQYVYARLLIFKLLVHAFVYLLVEQERILLLQAMWFPPTQVKPQAIDKPKPVGLGSIMGVVYNALHIVKLWDPRQLLRPGFQHELVFVKDI